LINNFNYVLRYRNIDLIELLEIQWNEPKPIKHRVAGCWQTTQ